MRCYQAPCAVPPRARALWPGASLEDRAGPPERCDSDALVEAFRRKVVVVAQELGSTAQKYKHTHTNGSLTHPRLPGGHLISAVPECTRRRLLKLREALTD